MPLTSRQRASLEKLFDVYYQHLQEPIHYTTLARALGVANSTAYDMLRLLEGKGYVASEYHLAEGRGGPGRSMVLFRPTMKALRLARRLVGEDARRWEWESVKAKVLERLAEGGLPDGDELLLDLVAGIPESQDPLVYCGRVLAASLLSVKGHLLERVHQFSLFRDMESGDEASLEALDVLPGFALGFSYAAGQDSSWLSRLAEHVRRYQRYLGQMDEGARRRLWRFSREVMEALKLPASTG